MRLVIAFIFIACALSAQRISGELRLRVEDATHAGLPASGLLESQSTGVRRTFVTDSAGLHQERGLPLGTYRLLIQQPGFSSVSQIINIRSELPIELPVTLTVEALRSEVLVDASGTLLDPSRTSGTQYLGRDILDVRRSATPGRSVLDLVNTQPGWLLEANGVLHPRGSEYDVQYVVDGLPYYDNRSPAFAQSLGIDEFQSLNVLTAGYPAEFGRKLGGVIELVTPNAQPGWHGKLVGQGGSFGQGSAFASTQYSRGVNSITASAEGFATDRYLDAPVPENFSNHASGGSGSLRYSRNWSNSDTTSIGISRHRTGFLVPNERLQQAAGQRQDRDAAETSGQLTHSHLFSPSILAQVRAMIRDTRAGLWSNDLSIPIAPWQDRGFREAYVGGSVAISRGQHEFKFGGEALFSSIRENFGFDITSRDLAGNPVFDDDVPTAFTFHATKPGRDQAAFVQDRWHRGPWTLSAGLRFDHYRLIADETAWSPRLGLAYSVPHAGLVLRASYDRVFQVPAVENILLASSNLVESLGGSGAFLPLKPSRGHFVEAGFSQSVAGRLRLDGSWFRRSVDNFADDSLLLNTGVSFPIAFRSAGIRGVEAKLELPRWGAFSGFVSYSNLIGSGELPVAGGLLLGDEAQSLLRGSGRFPISQDQRNSIRSRIRWQPHAKLWFAAAATYNSGLPFEIEGPGEPALLEQQYGARILSKIDLDRGRVRPSASIDLSVGTELQRRERYIMRLQADVLNVADRLNVINFAGVLSGTALEPGRNFAVRATFEF